MPTNDPRVDAYIAKAADFAKPILRRIRKVVRAVSPDIQETIKWGMPHFEHKGVICGMAAFKQHCALGFWQGQLIFGRKQGGEGAMGHFGRITSMTDLPSAKELAGYVRKAI